MIRLGAHPQQMRSFKDSDLLRVHVCFLIRMLQAFIDGRLNGPHRRNVLPRYAHTVGRSCRRWDACCSLLPSAGCFPPGLHHILFQRVKLLTVMAAAVVNVRFIGERRKTLLSKNMDFICDALGIANPPAGRRPDFR